MVLHCFWICKWTNENKADLHELFFKIFIIVSVGYDEYYADFVHIGYSQSENRTKNQDFWLNLGDIVSGKDERLLYVSTEPIPKLESYGRVLTFYNQGKCVL